MKIVIKKLKSQCYSTGKTGSICLHRVPACDTDRQMPPMVKLHSSTAERNKYIMFSTYKNWVIL